jgi:signal transduction histidine kinase/ActR/RegA family two-component response regulator
MATGSELAKAFQRANENFADYYGTPLIVKGEVKGVLEIYHHSPIKPNPDWLDFLETLAGQAAIAIDNAQLFDSLQRANSALEQRVQERTTELNRLNLELEQANRAKDEFLATMSHELRTPLNSILGLSESLLEQRREPLGARQQKSLETIAASGHHLLELINDILDLSKIEAGRLEYHPQIVVVEDLCQSSLAFVKEQADRKSVALTYEGILTVPKIYSDPRRLKQALINLLNNAVKFTSDHGQVSLQVHMDAELDRIQFSVIDNGIGIALQDMHQLFVPFVQVDSSLTREHEGTGLGLALVQKLIDRLGGSVDVESETGKGSRFTINLPMQQEMVVKEEASESGSQPLINAQTEKSDSAADDPAAGRVILLAEDNMANILTIGDYLESHGYQVVVAHNGLDAIEKAGEIQPNIILMDIQMPVLNGMEAISRLRADPRFESTPIIALTALAMPGDRERCLEAGANEYLSKPVSLKALLKTIDELLRGVNH